MIDLFPFAGLPVFVLGLGNEGLAAAKALRQADAEVFAWDDDASRRRAAAGADIVIRDPAEVDWREPVSLVIEHMIPHGGKTAHEAVAAARSAGCEVIGDAELLARSERDANYAGIVSEALAGKALDLIGYALRVSGRDCETGGDEDRPMLNLARLGFGGIYALSMPPERLDITMSITFDVAILLDVGPQTIARAGGVEPALEAASWLFHRQTGGRGAVVNVDDRHTRQVAEALQAAREQVVVPVSGKARAAGGVYVAGGTLFDDIAGGDQAIVGLDLPPGKAGEEAGLLAAATYASLVILDVPAHAAMASVRGYFAA